MPPQAMKTQDVNISMSRLCIDVITPYDVNYVTLNHLIAIVIILIEAYSGTMVVGLEMILGLLLNKRKT